MAISVKDIKEKDFTAENHGYSIEEVDDFLDEIADQVSELIRENFALKEKIKVLEEAPAPEAEKAAHEIDDSGYFKNLENAMRDSLINAQRIAEETRKNAETTAAATVEEARARAEAMTSEALAKVEACKAEAANIREAAESYRDKFRALIEEQVKSFKDKGSFFD